MVITPIHGNSTVQPLTILQGNKVESSKRKSVKNGFDVVVANGEKITQQAECIVPFDVPAAAAHVAVFENMPNVLLAAGPLIKAGCKSY